MLLTAWMFGAHIHTVRFFLHALTSRRYELDPNGDGDAFVPIPARFIRRHFRRARPEWLADAGLIEIRDHSRVNGLCREYRVTLVARLEFAEAGLEADASTSASRTSTPRLVDLVTGKRTTRIDKTTLTGPARHAYPPRIRAGMRAFGVTPFNMGAINRHLDAERARADAMPEGKAKTSMLSRCANDALCLRAVMNQDARPDNSNAPDGFWTYSPAYRVGTTGRLAQIGGGFQSCSREMKVAAYTDIPGFCNYDLKASQARGLIVLLGEAGFDASWIVDYVAAGKVAAAESICITVDLWKKVLYALLMGARVPSAAQARFLPQSEKVGRYSVPTGLIRKQRARVRHTFPYSRGTITEAILAETGLDGYEETYARFLDYTEGLREPLVLWHVWLDTCFIHDTGWKNPSNSNTYVRNEVGMTRAIETLSPSRYKRRAELAAFLLQGREAAFTHTLAASGKEFGFHPLSYEHDGLVVQGVIPQAAVERAALAARMPIEYITLEPKPFI